MASPKVDRLLELSRAAYVDMLPSLHADRGHCHEVACLIRALALAMGFERVRRCSGKRWLGTTPDYGHAWVELNGIVVHSPERGKIEVAGDEVRATMTEEWAAGPPASRVFKVGSRL
jgi:hypothetical protein